MVCQVHTVSGNNLKEQTFKLSLSGVSSKKDNEFPLPKPLKMSLSLPKLSLAASEAWFPLNVSMLATNQSCLLLHFVGFHKQPSLGLLRGFFLF